LTFRSSSDGHETPLRDEDTLIRRRHAKPALSVGDRGQAPKPPSGPPQAAGLRSVSHGRTINAAVRSSTRRTVSVKSSPDVYTRATWTGAESGQRRRVSVGHTGRTWDTPDAATLDADGACRSDTSSSEILPQHSAPRPRRSAAGICQHDRPGVRHRQVIDLIGKNLVCLCTANLGQAATLAQGGIIRRPIRPYASAWGCGGGGPGSA
jgi:hypothetical protein